MFDIALLVHSWLRWVALLAGLFATLAAFEAAPTGTNTRTDRSGLVLIIALDLQLVIGLLLYFGLSPTTAAILDNFGAAMRDPVARFWAVEHVSMMLVALVAGHLGRVLGRTARTPTSRQTRLRVCFGLATIALIAGIPWPGLAAGRPLFRFF